MFKTLVLKDQKDKFVIPSNNGQWFTVNKPIKLSSFQTIELLQEQYSDCNLDFDKVELIEVS